MCERPPRAVARAIVISLTVLAAGACGSTAAPDSVYTSIRPTDCAAPSSDVAATYSSRQLGVQQCPAPTGWRLLVVAADENTWIDLAGPNVVWSGEKPIVYESPIGNFPSVGDPPTMEWRRDGNGRPIALIFRVTAQERDEPDKRISMLYVVRLEKVACVIGRVTTNEEARRLADSGTPCRG